MMPFHPRGNIQRVDQTMNALRFISYVLAFAGLVYAILYLGPEGWVRRPGSNLDTQVSIVRHVENLGPIWPGAFMMVFLVGMGTTYFGKGLLASHALGAGVWMTYSLAILLGAFLSEPPAPVINGLTTLLGAMIHLGMARAWVGEGVR